MIVLLSQTKLPDSSNPLSDILGAVHLIIMFMLIFSIVSTYSDLEATFFASITVINLLFSYWLAKKNKEMVSSVAFVALFSFYLYFVYSGIKLGFQPSEVNFYFVDASRNIVSTVALFFQILYSAAYYRANNVLPKVTPIFTFIVAFMAYGRTGIALSLIFVVVTYAVSFWRSKVLYKFIFLLLTLILSVVAFRYFAVMENFILVETNFNSGFETPCTKMVKDYIASLDFFRIFTGSDLSAIPIIFQHDNNPHNSIIYGHSQYGIFYVLLLFSLMVIVIKNKR